MAYLNEQLEIDSCPHCGRANPTLQRQGNPIKTRNNTGGCFRWWAGYLCNSCGGIVSASAMRFSGSDNYLESPVNEVYPVTQIVNESIPGKAREYLSQAQNCLHAPSGAIMLSASAVDAMLKEKEYTEGSLYSRIDRAVANHLITDDMAKWAHQVRLDANDQRHADEDAGLPDGADGKRAFDFAIAFAEYLFVLPAKVSHGLGESNPKGGE